jgi:hypothetical protein
MPYDVFSYDGIEWRAVVDGVLQAPSFNSRGAASIFAQAVAEGRRKPEPATL